MRRLTARQKCEWEERGFFLIKDFAEIETCRAMQEKVIDLVRRSSAGESILPAFVQMESKLSGSVKAPEERISKLFRVHREVSLFRDFACHSALADLLQDLLGPDLDCFLSQFIFKFPGALGQPWHQDAFYFRFDRGPQVGIWLAVSDARMENGPLWVLPGSHREPVHEVVPDRREHANLGYVEIVDHDTRGEEVVLMQAGDLLVFHSHLFHRSTDNESDAMRAAMVYHFACSQTRDLSMQELGFIPPNMDWMTVRRGGSEPPRGAP